MQGSADESDSIDLLVARFRDSIAPDQYDAETFVPWSDLRESLSSSKDSIDRLQAWVNGRRQAVDLAKLLDEDSTVLTLIRLLVVAPGGVGLRDGRELPGDDTVLNPMDVAEVACDLGLRELLPKGVDVESLCRIGLVANDSVDEDSADGRILGIALIGSSRKRSRPSRTERVSRCSNTKV